MPPKAARSSETPIPTTENASSEASSVTEEQWKGMQDVLTHIYDFRDADGNDPSALFRKKVNKRVLPNYYDVIKEPIALSTIKSKLAAKEYKSFAEFVRDFALIPHNAQVYNRVDSGAYQDALVIKDQLTKQLQKLVRSKAVTSEEAKLPYLGEIPAQDSASADEEEEDDEEEEEEDQADDDDEDAPEEEEEGTKKRKRGRPKGSVNKRDKGGDPNDEGEKRRRGRPPKVYTPLEARLFAVLKGIRKPKNSAGQLRIGSFERLPDKTVMPEYFAEIKNPIAFDVIKRKLKRKKFQSMEHFMKDVDLMFDNAKQYNQDESEIYKDAVVLQTEAHRLADEERAKPDSDYAAGEGRIPMPDGILHNGELYRVGDWVLIQNANDLTKPIPSQIYRTWQDTDGAQWINACWYYRPEQTVHRFDKHFLDNEVAKTGQYRDHRVDEIIGRCFVMFVTRYFKGRPRNLPADTEVFVCDARYNEEKATFNKIKTWASCLPDEVREKDYEMTLFDAPRRMKKFPSPIAYLLKDEQKETDDIPKAEWGAENAPPKIGAVHRRPRDPRDSLPPEPTPSPPPQPPPAAARQAPTVQMTDSADHNMASTETASMTAQSPIPTQGAPHPFTASHPQHYSRPHASPGPAGYNRSPSLQGGAFPSTPQQAPMQATMTRTASGSNIPQQAQMQHQASIGVPPERPSSAYRGPAPIEVYTLPDSANASIPAEIRAQFQRDDSGRILFFTTPPVDTSADSLAETKNVTVQGHTIQFMAERAKRASDIAERRKEFEAARKAAQAAKRARVIEHEEVVFEEAQRIKKRALEMLEQQISGAADVEMKSLYNGDWTDARRKEDETTLIKVQTEEQEKWAEIEMHRREREERKHLDLSRRGGLLEDVGA